MSIFKTNPIIKTKKIPNNKSLTIHHQKINMRMKKPKYSTRVSRRQEDPKIYNFTKLFEYKAL